MHQDEPYFPHDNHSMIAAIIHFDDAPLEKGCVRVVPGSHKLGPLQHNPMAAGICPSTNIRSKTPCRCPPKPVMSYSFRI
jgi:ectoine hydroxylase-related dioxygenase (phytanoyl-CoA dioxygenase family)